MRALEITFCGDAGIMKSKQVQRSKVRALVLPIDQINANVLLPILCIGAGLMIPFVTIANLLMNRYL